MKLTFEITRQDYSNFSKFHFIKTRLTRTVIVGLLTIVIVQVYLNNEDFHLLATVISSIVCIAAYTFVIIFSLNRTKNIPNKNGAILGQKEFEFTAEKIFYKTDNSQGSFDWSTIKKMKESVNSFYLYTDANMAFLVPKRAFKDDIELKSFKDLVESKTKTVL